MARGRARMESLAETISSEWIGESVGGLIEELRHDAAPIVERATGRRRGRGPGFALIILGLVALAGFVTYLLWRRRDEEPAYLVHSPARPGVAPAGTPPDGAPATGPSGSQPGDSEPDARSPLVQPLDATPARELAAAPHAALGQHEVREDWPVERGRALPVSGSAPFAMSPVQLPGNARRPWLPR